jgi:hypothetical protein
VANPSFFKFLTLVLCAAVLLAFLAAGAGATLFYALSASSTAIVGNPNQRHAFQPVHSDTIQEVNKLINGHTWRYIAYDSDPDGTQIRLYYSNDTATGWTQYSPPILGPTPYTYRWPSTTYQNGVFYMFLTDRSGGTLERWSSTDGIHYTFIENVKSGGNEYKNPFIYYNSNDGRWYLYSHDVLVTGIIESVLVRSAATLDGLKSAADTILITRNMAFGAPTVMYVDGLYWLLAEAQQGGPWQIVAYYSSSPSSGFVEAGNSPVLSNDESCPVLCLTPNRERAFLYTVAVSSVWYVYSHEVIINAAPPTVSPTPTASPFPSPSPSPTVTPTPTPSPSSTPPVTPTPTPSSSPTPTATPTPTPPPSPTPTSTPTPTPSPSPSPSPSPTPELTSTPTETPQNTPLPTQTVQSTSTNYNPTPKPPAHTATPTPTPKPSPTNATVHATTAPPTATNSSYIEPAQPNELLFSLAIGVIVVFTVMVSLMLLLMDRKALPKKPLET